MQAECDAQGVSNTAIADNGLMTTTLKLGLEIRYPISDSLKFWNIFGKDDFIPTNFSLSGKFLHLEGLAFVTHFLKFVL